MCIRDRITPRPDPTVQELLKKDSIDGLDPVVTSKNTYVAPFVNAEECEYLVIEDDFPNGRPALASGGVSEYLSRAAKSSFALM